MATRTAKGSWRSKHSKCVPVKHITLTSPSRKCPKICLGVFLWVTKYNKKCTHDGHDRGLIFVRNQVDECLIWWLSSFTARNSSRGKVMFSGGSGGGSGISGPSSLLGHWCHVPSGCGVFRGVGYPGGAVSSGRVYPSSWKGHGTRDTLSPLPHWNAFSWVLCWNHNLL